MTNNYSEPISQNILLALNSYKYFENQNIFQKGIDIWTWQVYIADKYFESQNI